jgi:hypothetical protein
MRDTIETKAKIGRLSSRASRWANSETGKINSEH